MAYEKYVIEFEDKDGVVFGVMDEEAREEVSAKAPVIVQEASGDIVTISDGADGMPLSSCVVQIKPAQDLHGYDGPYLPGGGRNLLDPSAYTPAQVSPIYNSEGELVEGTRSGIYINLAPGTYTMSQNAIGTQYVRGNVLDSNDGFVSYFSLSVTTVNSARTFTIAEGERLCLFRATTSTGSLNLETSKFMLESGTEGHAYEPYENICPISGWTGANVYQTVWNIYDYLTAVSGSYYSLTDGVVSITRSYGTGGTTMPSFVMYAIGGQTVTLSADVRMSKDGDDNRNIVRLGLKANGVTGSFGPSYDATLSAYDTWERISYTFTLGDYAEWRVGIQPRYDGHTLQFKNVQVEFGSVAHDYTPYTGTVYPISWQTVAGTVYGGTLDVVTGVLTVSFLKQNLFGEGVSVSRKTTNTSGVYRLAVSGVTGIVIPGNSVT